MTELEDLKSLRATCEKLFGLKTKKYLKISSQQNTFQWTVGIENQIHGTWEPEIFENYISRTFGVKIWDILDGTSKWKMIFH